MPWSPLQPPAKLCGYKVWVLKGMSPPEIKVSHHSRVGKKQNTSSKWRLSVGHLQITTCLFCHSSRLLGSWAHRPWRWYVPSGCVLHVKMSGGNYPGDFLLSMFQCTSTDFDRKDSVAAWEPFWGLIRCHPVPCSWVCCPASHAFKSKVEWGEMAVFPVDCFPA